MAINEIGRPSVNGPNSGGHSVADSSRYRLANAAFLTLALLVLVYALFPGRFDGDTIGQLQEGVNHTFQDAHSVLMAALIGQLARIADGPGLMFTLQLALWFMGVALLTDAVIAAGHRAAGLTASAAAMIPLVTFDFVDVQSDALLTATAALLAGLGARSLLGRRRGIAATIAGFGLLAFSLDVRNNGIFLLFPLWFLFWPLRHMRLRPVALSALSAIVVFVAAGLVDRTLDYNVLRAWRMNKVVMLIVFDLAGITARTGADASGGMLSDFAAKAQRCYTPEWWDTFLSGGCKEVFPEAVQLMQDDARKSLFMKKWGEAIFEHPGAYARHRAAHFECLMRVGCDLPNPMTIGVSPVRPWDANAPPRTTGIALALERWALTSYSGPLGIGGVWLGVLLMEAAAAAILLHVRGFSSLRYLSLVLALARLSYGSAFAVIGIAHVMRYLHPMIFLSVIGIPLCLGGITSRRPL